MKIHVIGHASYFIEFSDGRTMLIDPVFGDTHQEGLLCSYPRREVHVDAILPSMVLISHRHMDHFDLSTLKILNRSIRIVVPNDEFIIYALRHARFENIVKLEMGDYFEWAGIRVDATHSRSEILEFGFLISADGVQIWNQIDTIVSKEIVQKINARTGVIDLALVKWQPLLDILPSHGGNIGFPYESYNKQLNALSVLNAKRMVLGACGFLYAKEYEWINHLAFPLSRKKALSDISTLTDSNEESVFAVDPGDLINIDKMNCTIHKNASTKVNRFEEWDDELIDFRPFKKMSYFSNECHRVEIKDLMQTLGSKLQEWIKSTPKELEVYRKWRVIYNLRLVQESLCSSIVIDFRDEIPEVVFKKTAEASLICWFELPALQGLLSGTMTWDRVILSGDFFQWHRIYRVNYKKVELPENVDIINPVFFIVSEQKAWNSFHTQLL